MHIDKYILSKLGYILRIPITFKYCTFCYGGCECSFAMVNMAYCSYVKMRFITNKRFFCCCWGSKS